MLGRPSYAFSLLAIATFILSAPGCGGPTTGTVKGKVTYQGKPVSDAAIQFQSADKGGGSAGKLSANGEYKMETPVPVGKYLVTIQPFDNLPPAGTVKEVPKPKERPDIPAKYRDLGKSGLSVNVTSGTTTFDVDMKDN